MTHRNQRRTKFAEQKCSQNKLNDKFAEYVIVDRNVDRKVIQITNSSQKRSRKTMFAELTSNKFAEKVTNSMRQQSVNHYDEIKAGNLLTNFNTSRSLQNSKGQQKSHTCTHMYAQTNVRRNCAEMKFSQKNDLAVRRIHNDTLGRRNSAEKFYFLRNNFDDSRKFM